MKFSLNWAKQYVDLQGLTTEQISHGVGQTLAEVEQVIETGSEYQPIVVAKITKVEKHPNADKLVVVEVDAGPKHGTKQVVTGAPNVTEKSIGNYAAYIPVNAKVPYNAYPDRFDGIIKPIKLRGVESQGMLCSEKELALSDDHSGIWFIDPKAFSDANIMVGLSLAKLFDLEDTLLEIENKSLTHRGDVFSIIGVARELSAAFGRPFKAPDLPSDIPAVKDAKQLPLQASIRSTTTTHRFSAVVLSNVTIKPSPWWLRMLLVKYGLHSVNNVVDVTNYIMLELGQPMHAFDYDKLVEVGGKPEIIVRKANTGETIVGLDHKTYTLPDHTTIITANNEPVGIGGVLGGESTAISESTKHIVLEAANFDRFNIRKTSMALGIFTDAASIFSRYQDPHKTTAALHKAITLLQELAGAQVASQLVDVYPEPQDPKHITFSITKANQFIGEELPSAEILSILEHLELQPKLHSDNDTVEVTVPTFRDDLGLVEDLYEELVRIHGLNKVKETVPIRTVTPPANNPVWDLKQKIRGRLISQGLYETVNFNFVSEQLYKDVGLSTQYSYKITNAISPEVQYMRTLVLPGLIAKTKDNLRYYDRFGLFEIGRVHRKDLTYDKPKAQSIIYTPAREFNDPDELPVEDQHIGGIVTDTGSTKAGSAYYRAKLHIDQLVAMLHIPEVEYNHYSEFSSKAIKQMPLWLQQARELFHPGKSSIVTANVADKNMYLGVVGELQPSIQKKMGLPDYTAAFELGLYMLQDSAVGQLQYHEPSRFPVVEQDLCFVVNTTVPYEAVVKSIEQGAKQVSPEDAQGGSIVHKIVPVDIYQDAKDKKSKQITVRITLQSNHATLTDDIVKKTRQAIIKQVEKEVQGKLK